MLNFGHPLRTKNVGKGYIKYCQHLTAPMPSTKSVLSEVRRSFTWSQPSLNLTLDSSSIDLCKIKRTKTMAWYDLSLRVPHHHSTVSTMLLRNCRTRILRPQSFISFYNTVLYNAAVAVSFAAGPLLGSTSQPLQQQTRMETN